MTEIYGNPHTFSQGQGIGDLFNGILSIVSHKQKQEKINEPIFISVPQIRNEIVHLFNKGNCIPINEPILNKNLHVVGIERTKELVRPISLYDYFIFRDLEGKDLFEDYHIPTSKMDLDIMEDDIIIFPMTSGAKLLDNKIFTDILNQTFKKYRKIFWNKEPNNNYRNNTPAAVNTINLGILDLLSILKTKKPKIIGQRSGMFDILFHTLPEIEMHCIYDTKDPIQMLWKLKNQNEKLFLDYINKRDKFNEIFI